MAFLATAFAAIASPAFAQSSPKAGAPKKGGETRPPAWVLPPVTGTNLQTLTFDSKMAGAKVSYVLYLPPGYESSGRRFPVVYWLHGLGGAQEGVPRLTTRLTSAIAAAKAPAMIFVFVNGLPASMYCDSADGKWPVEQVIVRDLIPHIDATCRTIASREGRMIEGFSMGGFGAMKLGFEYPDLFGSISSIAGALHNNESFARSRANILNAWFGGDVTRFEQESPWTLATRNAARVKGRTLIRQIVGDQDPTRTYNAGYHELLEKLGVAHEYALLPGIGHSHDRVYEALGEENWAFYRQAFAAAAAAKSAGSN